MLGLLVEAVAIVLLMLRPWAEPTASGGRKALLHLPSTSDPTEPSYRGQPGPWGELIYTHINLEPADEFTEVKAGYFEPTQWHFVNYSREKLLGLLASSDLTPEQRGALSNTNAWQFASNAIIVMPSRRVVLGLSSRARSQIYSVLAEHRINTFHAMSFTFQAGEWEEWMAQSKLSEPTLTLLKRLTYERGSSICFSDLPEMFETISSVSERQRLLKTLMRNATLLMKLHVQPDTDVNALVAYWGRGRRSKDLLPLLESLKLTLPGMTIDVAHLLPAFARKRLFMYPDPEDGSLQDCYWTAMNFFNDPPDNRFMETTAWIKELATEYTSVAEPTFGDVALLLDPNNAPFHAAVYVADNVLFTKNGGALGQPWLLMRWEDLLARYPQNYQVRVSYYRRKHFAVGAL